MGKGISASRKFLYKETAQRKGLCIGVERHCERKIPRLYGNSSEIVLLYWLRQSAHKFRSLHFPGFVAQDNCNFAILIK